MTTDISKEHAANMPEGNTPVQKEAPVTNGGDAVAIKGEDKTDTIVTQQEQTPKDDCSDLTDNNNDGEEQIPRSFPQKVSARCNNEKVLKVGMSRVACLYHGRMRRSLRRSRCCRATSRHQRAL
jgi:hypothetical protein